MVSLNFSKKSWHLRVHVCVLQYSEPCQLHKLHFIGKIGQYYVCAYFFTVDNNVVCLCVIVDRFILTRVWRMGRRFHFVEKATRFVCRLLVLHYVDVYCPVGAWTWNWWHNRCAWWTRASCLLTQGFWFINENGMWTYNACKPCFLMYSNSVQHTCKYLNATSFHFRGNFYKCICMLLWFLL